MRISDWSSDVCSSDPREQQAPGGLVDDFTLDAAAKLGMLLEIGERDADRPLMRGKDTLVAGYQRQDRDRIGGADVDVPAGLVLDTILEIGRAAGRVRVGQYV